MKNRYLHLINFDLKVLVLNRVTLLQVLFTQAFMTHLFARRLAVLHPVEDGFWRMYILAAGFFVLNMVNFFSFEFSFSKVRRFNIAESLFASPISCRGWIYSTAAACVLFNAANMLVHLLMVSWLAGGAPFGLAQAPSMMAVLFVHASIVLLLGLASVRTGVYSAANIAVFVLTVFGLTAFGVFNGFGRALSSAVSVNVLAGASMFFAAAIFLVYRLADAESFVGEA
ncbi:MAG TPA: hypothetical protein PLL10_01035 [Elusimicrobiales bacterium]|nr:hypothetical protein [Elusimicrobiales bacterium]